MLFAFTAKKLGAKQKFKHNNYIYSNHSFIQLELLTFNFIKSRDTK